MTFKEMFDVQFEFVKLAAADVFQRFLRENENLDERQLVLKGSSVDGLPPSFVADQIASRRKAKLKLPSYYRTEGIVYPPALNLEQSSSEQTSRFKAAWASGKVGRAKLAVDLTGGFGIDTFGLASKFEKIIYVEPSAHLTRLAQHNHQLLGLKNVEYVNLTAEDFLETFVTPCDLIFVDPSRRSISGRRVHALTDCSPNIVGLNEKIFSISGSLLVKASPLLDIKAGIRSLGPVSDVLVVAVENECKELLFFCSREAGKEEPTIYATNLKNDEFEEFSFRFIDEEDAAVGYSMPLKYLLEPNAAILKAGAFRSCARRFEIAKLDRNSHLYTSENLNPRFPGRQFEVLQILKDDRQAVASHFPDGKANVIVRNYPSSTDALKKKYRLTDGGEKFLIATSAESKRLLVVARRIV